MFLRTAVAVLCAWQCLCASSDSAGSVKPDAVDALGPDGKPLMSRLQLSSDDSRTPSGDNSDGNSDRQSGSNSDRDDANAGSRASALAPLHINTEGFSKPIAIPTRPGNHDAMSHTPQIRMMHIGSRSPPRLTSALDSGLHGMACGSAPSAFMSPFTTLRGRRSREQRSSRKAHGNSDELEKDRAQDSKDGTKHSRPERRERRTSDAENASIFAIEDIDAPYDVSGIIAGLPVERTFRFERDSTPEGTESRAEHTLRPRKSDRAERKLEHKENARKKIGTSSLYNKSDTEAKTRRNSQSPPQPRTFLRQMAERHSRIGHIPGVSRVVVVGPKKTPNTDWVPQASDLPHYAPPEAPHVPPYVEHSYVLSELGQASAFSANAPPHTRLSRDTDSAEVIARCSRAIRMSFDGLTPPPPTIKPSYHSRMDASESDNAEQGAGRGQFVQKVEQREPVDPAFGSLCLVKTQPTVLDSHASAFPLAEIPRLSDSSVIFGIRHCNKLRDRPFSFAVAGRLVFDRIIPFERGGSSVVCAARMRAHCRETHVDAAPPTENVRSCLKQHMLEPCEGKEPVLPVALKVILFPQLAASPTNEVEILVSINHPAIPRLYAVFPTLDNTGYVAAMDLFEGSDLTRSAARLLRIDRYAVASILGQILEVLVYLHDECLVLHRDIKPDNVVVHRDIRGRIHVRLIDFAFASRLVDGAPVEDSLILGTVQYMAPEVMLLDIKYVCKSLFSDARHPLPDLPYDHIPAQGPHTDIYSAAMTIASFVLSDRSFMCSPQEVVSRVSPGTNVIHKYREEFYFYPGLYDLLSRMLEWDPQRRGTAAELLKSDYFAQNRR